jgi:hypothetical protein
MLLMVMMMMRKMFLMKIAAHFILSYYKNDELVRVNKNDENYD